MTDSGVRLGRRVARPAPEEFRLSRIYALESAASVSSPRAASASRQASPPQRCGPIRSGRARYRLLIEAHLRNGNRFDALSQYAAYRDLLAEELDTSPGRAVTALVTGIGSGAMTRAQRPGRRVAGARGVA